MLGKLIKYDMRALSRFLVLIHAFLLLFALLGRFFLTSRIRLDLDRDGVLMDQMPLALAIVLFAILVTSASFVTSIIIAIRFYKNLYSTEGYLSQTLPVSQGIHLLSKTTSGTLWTIIDLLLISLSSYIFIWTPSLSSLFQEHKSELLDELGFASQQTAIKFLIMYIFFIAFSSLANVIMIEASIVCGQLFSGHRILGAVVSFFALSTIISIFSLVALNLSGYFRVVFIQAAGADSVKFSTFMGKTFLISGTLTVFITIVLYLFSHFVMSKKINIQ